jgi:murein DD-endopeptidase MepM/ murein hydrolase activator NlpD
MHRKVAMLAISWLSITACTGASDKKDRRPVDQAAAPKRESATAGSTVAKAATKASTASAALPENKNGPRFVSVTVETNLEKALVDRLGKELGTPLSQVANRTLVWWIDMPKDLRKGDKVELVYEPRANEEPLLDAVWFTSGKLGKTVSGVAYRASGEPYARFYDQDGQEIEERLEDSPIEHYEQITSRLNDGRKHKGVDFKTPVGTEVHAPFDGVVIRKNWGRRNGNCIELEDAHTGRHAKFLHLDTLESAVVSGAHVKKGQLIAHSGNTGRSMAPHLHYQLEVGGRPVDPFRIHKTWRAKLPPEEAEKAKAMLVRYSELRTGAS